MRTALLGERICDGQANLCSLAFLHPLQGIGIAMLLLGIVLVEEAGIDKLWAVNRSDSYRLATFANCQGSIFTADFATRPDIICRTPVFLKSLPDIIDTAETGSSGYCEVIDIGLFDLPSRFRIDFQTVLCLDFNLLFVQQCIKSLLYVLLRHHGWRQRRQHGCEDHDFTLHMRNNLFVR